MLDNFLYIYQQMEIVMENLFDRDGNKPTASIQFDEKGKPFFIRKVPCGRCAGQGIPGWHPSGLSEGRCFQCGGACYFPKKFKLYTAEKLEKMNAVRDAKRAKKAEAARIKAEQEAAKIAARQDQATKEAKSYLERIEALGMTEGDGFLADIYRKITTKAMLMSEKQLIAVENTLNKIEAEITRKENADYVGEIGQRIEIELEFVRSIFIGAGYAYNSPDVYLTICRTPEGNTVIYKGACNGLGFSTTYDEENEYRTIDKGSKVKVKATIKEHKEYNGEKQTTINRPKKMEN